MLWLLPSRPPRGLQTWRLAPPQRPRTLQDALWDSSGGPGSILQGLEAAGGGAVAAAAALQVGGAAAHRGCAGCRSHGGVNVFLPTRARPNYGLCGVPLPRCQLLACWQG